MRCSCLVCFCHPLGASSCGAFKEVAAKVALNSREWREEKQAAHPEPVASSGREKAVREEVGVQSPELDLDAAGDQGWRKSGLRASREVLPWGLGKDIPPSTSSAFLDGFG